MTTLASGSYTLLDSQAIADIVRGPDGLGFRKVIEDATLVEGRAKELVGVSEGWAQGTTVIGGEQAHLRDTIVKRIIEDASGVSVLVGSEHPIALLHHTGTTPHVIRARAGKTLRFAVSGGSVRFSPGGGFLVFTKSVNHPGTAPNPYLVQALEEVMSQQIGIAA